MKEPTTYYEGLITNYLSGEASPDEVAELSGWITEDEANLAIFESFYQTWLLTGKEVMGATLDIDREWKAVEQRLSESQPSQNQKSATPGSGRLIKLRVAWISAAAIAVLALVMGAVYLLNFQGTTKLTADHGKLETTLPDGSLVILLQGSSIEYPEAFDEDTREVTLNGEASFSVQYNPSQPFIVSGGDARIRVLGTRFNVNTKAGKNKVSVVLTSGSVSLYFKSNEQHNKILIPGEKGTLDAATGEIVTLPNDDPNYNAWVTGKLEFNNTGLEAVCRTLEKVYNKKISVQQQNLKHCALTATFEGQSLESVLSVVAATLDLTVTTKDELILISGAGCTDN